MTRLELLWSNLRSSFWFVPSLIFAASIGIAVGLIEFDSRHAHPWIAQWPRLFGAGAGGARDVLSTIAGSMMTVVGVTFSMTLVTLALASSQYTSRILRNFMADRITQVVLGVFGGIYIYCLIVLRTVRGGDEDYVPSLAVFFGVVLAICGIAILIFFIHHIATAIQASSIIESVAKETLSSIERQFPRENDREGGSEKSRASGSKLPLNEYTQIAVSEHFGYIQSIDVSRLARLAHRNDAFIQVRRCVGDFVVRGAAVASISVRIPSQQKLLDEIRSSFNIHRFRTIEQDVGFGVRQIVDIALRALSPSVNDTTTGVMCVDYLSAILSDIAGRSLPSREHYCEGTLRVLTIEPTFEGLLSDAFDEIRGSARDNLAVLARMLGALQTVGVATGDFQRRRALSDYASRMQEMRSGLVPGREVSEFDELLSRTQSALGLPLAT